MNKIFVYGTLKKGYGNHRFVEKSKFLNYGVIKGYKLYHTPYGFPAIFKSNDEEDFVVGEVYEVDEDTSKDVDMLEGYISPNNKHNLYEKLCAVDIISYKDVEVYVMNNRMVNSQFTQCNPIWIPELLY